MLPWLLFSLFALGLLVLDLRVFHRAGGKDGFRAALGWTIFYVALALTFAGVLFFWQGRQASVDFVTGYVLELSLSADNLFVFLVIFNFFAVPEQHQHRVLFWGVLGALVLRGAFIGAGVSLLQRFHWLLYVFGAILVYSGIRFLVVGDRKINPATNPVVRTLRRFIPVTANYQGGQFLVRNPQENLRLYATPLLIVLLVIETTDLLFAVDSIPAVLAITLNAFIVYTSNVFAILGLRSMYFAVAGLLKLFRFLHYGLALILILVGAKMLASEHVRIATEPTLAAVGAILFVSIALSVIFPAPAKATSP